MEGLPPPAAPATRELSDEFSAELLVDARLTTLSATAFPFLRAVRLTELSATVAPLLLED